MGRVKGLQEREKTKILKGTAFEIYRFMLTADRPLGAREIQRALNLSSPSVAQHHLLRLARAGFVKHELGNYVVDKVMLDNCVKIGRFIIPRYLFYTLLAAFALLFELTFLQPNSFYQEYFFSVGLTVTFLLVFCYETFKMWRKNSL